MNYKILTLAIVLLTLTGCVFDTSIEENISDLNIEENLQEKVKKIKIHQEENLKEDQKQVKNDVTVGIEPAEWETYNNSEIGVSLNIPGNYIDKKISDKEDGKSSISWMYNQDPLHIYRLTARNTDYSSSYGEGYSGSLRKYIDLSTKEAVLQGLKDQKVLVERVLSVDQKNNKFVYLSIFVYGTCHISPVGIVQQKTNTGYDYIYFRAEEIVSGQCDKYNVPLKGEDDILQYLESKKYQEFLKIFKSIEVE